MLFGGALLAVPAMNSSVSCIAAVTAVRWSFEGSAAITELKQLFEQSTSRRRGAPIQYEESFNWTPYWYWAILSLFILVPLSLALAVLAKKTQPR